jgi:hypothetical protein
MKTKTQSGKRILEVKIIRAVDTDPDTSYLGEYAGSPTSQYSIDRAHSQDCQALEANHRQALDQLERILGHVMAWRSLEADNANSSEWEALDLASDAIENAQAEVQECDCSGGDKLRGEYQYFNPSSNYVDEKDQPRDGLTPDEVRKYTRQDYERMEDYNANGWCYLGLRAVAKYQTSSGSPIQTLSSGGLWGIESDSDSSYFAEVAGEELAQLRTELKALGFSARAIASAFKNVAEVES